MSPNLLSQIGEWIKDNNLADETTTNAFLNTLKNFSNGNYIYPGLIMRKLNLSTEKVYNLLNMLSDKYILKENYEIYCHFCSKYHHKFYEYYGDIPEYVECESCFNKLVRSQNVVVIYKVIKDD
jgi:hypothetical protein